jgi:putative DNA primase/helicase
MLMATIPSIQQRVDSAEEIPPAERGTVFPANYDMTQSGLIYIEKGREGEPRSQIIAGPFKVLAKVRDERSQSWGLLLEWQDSDDKIHRLVILRSLLAGDGLEVRTRLLDGGLYLASDRKSRGAFQSFLSQVEIDRRARCVPRIGWHDGAFALPDRTIETGAADAVIYQGTAALDHEFHEKGTLEGWRAMARLAVGNSRLAVALCAGFVGPLLKAVGGEGGGLHLRGASSIGKSTALYASASIWGPPSFVRQWRATANGLEGVAELSNDCALILDELAQLDPGEAGKVAYLLANGSGKSRASQTGEARTAKRWLTFFLSSGENSLAEHARSDGRGRRSAAGQEVRILDVEADARKGLGLFDTLHGFADGEALARAIKAGAAEHYGIAGPAFVRALLGQLEDAAQIVRQGVDRFVASVLPTNATGQVQRACHRFGLIAMAGELAVDRGILPWQQGEATNAAKIVFADWLEGRGGAGAAEDRAAIERLRAIIEAHGDSRFEPVVQDENTPRTINRLGFWRNVSDEREYLFLPEAWKEVCAGVGLDPRQAARALAAAGRLRKGGDGKNTMTVTLPGIGKTRCYVVTSAIFGSEKESGGDD